MNERLTITSFYKKYKDVLPFSLPTLRKYLKQNEGRLPRGILLTIRGKRNTYRVIDEEKLLSFIVGGDNEN